MSTMDITLADSTDLSKQSSLFEPLLYYSSTPEIAVEYVSDIHLLHHVRFFDNNTQKTIKNLARALYASRGESQKGGQSQIPSIRLFLGDISSDCTVTIEFFRQYMMQDMYCQFKQFRQAMRTIDDIHVLENRRKEYKQRKKRLSIYIKRKRSAAAQIKKEINNYISYNNVIARKGNIEIIRAYLDSDAFKKRNIPDYVTDKILTVAQIYEELRSLEQIAKEIQEELSKPIPKNPTKLEEFHYTKSFLDFVVLGNHEYIGFPDVDTAVAFYREKLKPMGYVLLQNEMCVVGGAVIYGGSGFAKYSEQYNAYNLPNCDAMMGNREYEIEQTSLFEDGYNMAKEYAQQKGKCFFCAAHYPVESCLGKYDKEAIFFSGHTHRNIRVVSEEKVLYADNQIGYHNNGGFNGIINFKCATTGYLTNPYSDLADGYYETTPDVYFQFCHYINEYISENLIKERCEKGNLFVIKSQGYYGFFILNKAGISIVNGGKTKGITSGTNMEWIYENFNCVVNKYLVALGPLRTRQEQLSQELKRLGFDGTIHGLIVDINFFNHIMVNPVDGSITFYYSPVRGRVKQFESFRKQLEFMGCTALLKENPPSGENNIVDMVSKNKLFEVENSDICGELMTVSMSSGAYGVSRSVSPFQRLFTGHVLRDFNIILAETENPSAKKRKKSWLFRIYMDKDFINYLVTEDDLSESVTLMDVNGVKKRMSALTIKKLCERKDSPAFWQTKDIKETLDYIQRMYPNGEELPIAWYTAIATTVEKYINQKE